MSFGIELTLLKNLKMNLLDSAAQLTIAMIEAVEESGSAMLQHYVFLLLIDSRVSTVHRRQTSSSLRVAFCEDYRVCPDAAGLRASP